ncbi:RING finger protein 223 [Parambassis ranga]|uniref:RING finger protein 223-like n=1 Tax=Parambassis ranga TaxID=210632 RepID=A0A6P7J1R2_9TELE|nr:RING finger protein 223-like [Parambassis ranga]XP_028270474.1 RING finger protein 223-like [Parambassis ranga]XP_028270475.1 RING finger protein 223-like [Parambassis ranga]
MNPYIHTNPHPCEDVTAPGSLSNPPPPCSGPGPGDDPSLSTLPVIHTGHSSLSVPSHESAPHHPSSNLGGGQNLARSQSSLPGAPPSGLGLSFRRQVSLSPIPSLNPYPAPTIPTSCQVSVIIPSPDLHPSPLQLQCSEESFPDLECAICFSQFNNVFRCPKMLQCKHTFCLECLARINVKSAEPNAIQCPLCRSFTPLPTLGLPKLTTDPSVLSCLPSAMQRVYSIRFLRSKGKLQVKRATEGQQRWGQRSLTSLRSENRSLDVGLPSPPPGAGGGGRGIGGTLFRLTGQPACRAFLLTSVVMMMMLLTGIIIFLLTRR